VNDRPGSGHAASSGLAAAPADPAAGAVAAGEPATGQSAAGRSAVSQSAVSQSAVGRSAGGQSTSGQSAAGQSGSAAPRVALHAAINSLEKIILGKPDQIRLCVACLLARGHLLIEDVPGVGKTTLAHALAHVLGLAWQRVQFTSDLLPADIIGVSVFDRATQQFDFRKGPIFTQLLLADEVNRASPRTQSALLEAMEERQVSADVTTYRLPEPFFVVATQNPHEQLGTFALPESQLDRFLMRVTLGYPDAAHERELLRNGARRDLLAAIPPALNPDGVIELQGAVRNVFISDALLDYAQALVARTRERADLKLGLSPRAGQGLMRAAQAWAYIAGRNAVLPDDVQAVFPAVVSHRLERRDAAFGAGGGAGIATELIRAVPVPP
jgi:MoxR-like ATPase